MPVAKSLNQEFFDTWSSDMAYVLGFFAADGAMILSTKGAGFVEFHNTDRMLIASIRRAIGSDHRISARARPRPWKTAYRLQIGSKKWFSQLTELGFTQKKSLTLRMTAVPDKYSPDFVRGYFDGDGCVYFRKLKYADRDRKRWILVTLFTSGSEAFLVSLWEMLRRHGIKGGSLQKKNRGFDLKFSHKDSVALYRLMYNNGPVRLFLPRKRRKLEDAIRVLGLDRTMRV